MALGVMNLIDADPKLKERPNLESAVGIRARSLLLKDISSLSLGEIAFCLRQNIAVASVAPRALAELVGNPFVCAEHYAGDLLASLLHAANQGQVASEVIRELRDICSSAIAAAETIRESVVPDLVAFVDKQDAT